MRRIRLLLHLLLIGCVCAWAGGGIGTRLTAATTQPSGTVDLATARQWWAFQAPREPPVPQVRRGDWAKDPIDAFILAKLEEKGLSPAPPADRRTLIRRATFDLIGLPPTPEEVNAFLADESPTAFAKVVDRLLASSAYGERWGRHWLDVVRYTDSFDARGTGGEGDCTFAWRYRDWVVDAFNHDLPYDQFVAQQIAGDLLPAGGASAPSQAPAGAAGVIPTGVYAIGEWGGGDADKEKLLTDIADDQVDLTGRAFLGLTLACARCHDHKFDPISQADYYGLAGIFFSTHIIPNPGPKTNGPLLSRIPLVDPKDVKEKQLLDGEIAALDQKIVAVKEDGLRALIASILPQTDQYLLAAWDYAHRPADRKGQTARQFAADRKLNEYALGQWISLLDRNDASVKLLAEAVRDIGGNKGFDGWRNPGPSGTPCACANSTDHPITVGTLTVPAHRIAVHPSPTTGCAIGWRSPIEGAIRIRGRVADGDDKCGDGIAWRLSLRAAAGTHVIASGRISNGGAQALDEPAKAAQALDAVDVHVGDLLELVVLPKADYSCDTTAVELQVDQRSGARRQWDATKDLTGDLLAGGHGNPHADAFGNAATWLLYETPIRSTPPVAQPGSQLAAWLALARSTEAPPSREQIVHLAGEVSAALAAAQDADAKAGPASPDREVYRLLTDPGGPFWADARTNETVLLPEAQKALAALRTQQASLKKQASAAVPMAHGLLEGGCPQSGYAGFHDVHVMIRGKYDRPAELVPRRFPRVLAGDDQPPITRGSGRLELAKWVASAQNPLTARVMVNRIWQHHFGEGLVRTANNFGKLGAPPTHPALLDYLAVQFVKSGWSIKQMHRRIMLSAVYQQSSLPSAAALKSDPENLLLAHMPRRRIEAEAIRDSLLAVAGRLDMTPGGPAFPDLSIPRRTLYVRTIRSDRSSYRMLFDAPDPQTIADRRTDSTVAPQALFLLDNPFVLEQAKALANRVTKETADEPARIDRLYNLLFARPPTAKEIDIGRAALARARDHGGDPTSAWEQYCQLLLCTNEFVYVD